MATRTLKRFTNYLTTTIVTLVTGTLVLFSASLFIYFELRLESEFKKKLLAQRGQIETILETRLETVQHQLRDASRDNALARSLALADPEQLSERLRQLSVSVNGAFFAVSTGAYNDIALPPDIPLPRRQLQEIINQPARGTLLKAREQFHLCWSFNTPVTSGETQLGTIHAVYDVMMDYPLIRTIRREVEGDVVIADPEGFISLLSSAALDVPVQGAVPAETRDRINRIGPEWVLASLGTGDGLFFVSSRQNLTLEKKGLAMLMGLSTIFVLGLSLSISYVLSRQLGRPLGEMATKAIQISEGNKEIFFGNTDGKFLEFRMLHQAFDHMLMNLITAEEKSRYKELLGNVDDAVYLVDKSGNIMDANEATYVRLGYSAKTFFELNIGNVLPVEEANIFLAQLSNSTQTDPSKKTIIETFHIRKDKSRLPVEINSRPILYRGRPVLLHVARDLTQRKAAEKALRESERRYRRVVENSHSGILILGPDFQILYANNEVRNILGYDLGELRGHPFQEILSGDKPGYSKIRFWQNNIPVVYQPVYEHDMMRKDGNIRRCKTRASIIEGSEGTANLLLQILDITDTLRAENETRKLEAQLFQAQKMQAIGRLAGGVAHDFNNILMAIQGRVSLMRLDAEPDHPHAEYVEEIGKSVKNAANLTRQLLGFARGGKYQAKTTDLNDLVDKSLHMFQRTHRGINVFTQFQRGIWLVEVDRTQLDQVLLNLFLNAAHAMPDGGDLTVTTRNRRLNGMDLIEYGLPPGDYVNVSVSDTGAGMDSDVRERVFEPFFTTKPMGLGTGLGLASAYGIIKNHKGGIHAESRKGKGSTFQILLPVTDSVSRLDLIHESEALTGKETILLVDDQPEFLEIGSKMIETLGYQAQTVLGGNNAVDLLEKDEVNPDLIILDMVMPEMSGSEVFKKIKERKKDVRVLLCSGYNLGHQATQLISQGCRGFIQKPFDIHQLGRKLKEALSPMENHP